MFTGFSPDGLELLGRLPTFDKEQFQAQKSRYEETLQRPLKSFVDALGPRLSEEISSTIQFAARTHGSIGPINNDVRFNPKASTYKDHVLLRFWDGESKKTAPTLFVRLTSSEVGFATGVVFSDVDTWRTAVDSDGDDLAAAIAELLAVADAHLVEPGLKRVPPPYDPRHPHSNLLRHKGLQVRWPRPLPSSVSSADFVEYCSSELAKAKRVHLWLAKHLS